MRAIQLLGRGGPGDLGYYEDAPDPKPESGDAIVRVYACAIAPEELGWAATWETRGGGRRMISIPGHEIAGIVDRVPDMPESLRDLERLEEGPRTLRPGDEVYGMGDAWRDGGAAEFMAIRARDLAPKPQRLSWAEAAAVPRAALTAWQGLRDRAHLAKGQRVLILNADSSAGMYAVQLARTAGAYVIAAASAEDRQGLLTSLGADEVMPTAALERKLEQVEERKLEPVDVVFDTAGGEALERSWKLLRQGGVLVTTEGSVDPEKADKYNVTALQFIAQPSRDALVEIGRLIDAGQIRPVIESVMPLREARQAFELGLEQHRRGKIVLEVVPQRLGASAAASGE